MNDHLRILEVSSLASRLITDDHPAHRVVLKRIYAVFQISANHTLAKCYRSYSLLPVATIKKPGESVHGALECGKHHYFTVIAINQVRLLIDEIHRL